MEQSSITLFKETFPNEKLPSFTTIILESGNSWTVPKDGFIILYDTLYRMPQHVSDCELIISGYKVKLIDTVCAYSETEAYVINQCHPGLYDNAVPLPVLLESPNKLGNIYNISRKLFFVKAGETIKLKSNDNVGLLIPYMSDLEFSRNIKYVNELFIISDSITDTPDGTLVYKTTDLNGPNIKYYTYTKWDNITVWSTTTPDKAIIANAPYDVEQDMHKVYYKTHKIPVNIASRPKSLREYQAQMIGFIDEFRHLAGM